MASHSQVDMYHYNEQTRVGELVENEEPWNRSCAVEKR